MAYPNSYVLNLRVYKEIIELFVNGLVKMNAESHYFDSVHIDAKSFQDLAYIHECVLLATQRVPDERITVSFIRRCWIMQLEHPAWDKNRWSLLVADIKHLWLR